MKKGRSVILGLSIAALTLGGFGAGVYAYSQIKLVVNGKNISTPIEVMDGTSYVPLRAVSEALGAQVTWDEHTQTVEISRMPGSPVGAAKQAQWQTETESIR
ncbi:copper amine oxidase N-terminal domain-containing protein [Paenibacillus sp. P26]|nr:copper amine oxidase N-terminal domain-containing protein [Paenibacillus sp. P26]